METTTINRGALARESTPFCIDNTSPLPQPESGKVGDWLPFRFDAGQLNEQAGEVQRIEYAVSGGDFGGDGAEIDSLPDTDNKDFVYRSGTANIGIKLMSVPDFTESATYPSLLATPAGMLLESGTVGRSAVTTRTVAATGQTDSNTFDVAAVPGDLFQDTIIGFDSGGRREAALVTGIDGTDITVAPGLGIDNGNTVRIGQLFESKAGGDIGRSVVFKHDFLGGRDYMCGGRWTQLGVVANKRRCMLNFTVDFPVIFTDPDAAGVATNTNVRDVIREPGGRRHATFAGTKPRIGPNAYSLDATTTLPMTVNGEVLPIDEFTLTVTNELGERGTFDAVSLGDRDVDNVTVEAEILLSSSLTTLDLKAVGVDASNFHLFVLPLGPTGAHGGAIAFFAQVVNDQHRADYGKSYRRRRLSLRSAPGPHNQAPFRIVLF